MTCIVAVRGTGVTWLAADRLITDDEGQGSWVSSMKLWQPAPTLCIGFAGDLSLIQYIRHGVDYEDLIPDAHGLERPVGWFYQHVLIPLRKAAKEDEVEGDVTMVVALGGSLLMVGSRWDIFEHEGSFITAGSGGAYALGFLCAITRPPPHPLYSAKQAAHEAVACAMACDTTVGGGVTLFEVQHE